MQATPLHVPQRLARRLWHSLLGSLGLLLLAAPLQAEQDVSAQLIKLGMVNAQSGNAAEIGLGMRQGAEAYLRRINAAGGIHGRQLLLLSRDDGYEPVRTAQHTRELIEQAQVFALFGYVGTPTSRAAVPIAEAHQVPYLFPFSGAQFLRTPLRPGVFNLRAAYFDGKRPARPPFARTPRPASCAFSSRGFIWKRCTRGARPGLSTSRPGGTAG